MGLLGLGCSLCTGMMPGSALYIELFVNAGMMSSMCPAHMDKSSRSAMNKEKMEDHEKRRTKDEMTNDEKGKTKDVMNDDEKGETKDEMKDDEKGKTNKEIKGGESG